MTRNKIIRPVLRYRLVKGRLCRAVKKLVSSQLEGRIFGGMAMASDWVLKLVSSIHKKGKIMVTLPSTSAV